MMNVEIIDLTEVIESNEEDSPTGEAIPTSLGEQFTSKIRSLCHKDQLLAIEQLRASLRINNCPLVYNPGSSFAFNLALKVNSVDFEAFKKNEILLERLITMGNAVVRVYKDCDSQKWLTHIIKKVSEMDNEQSTDVQHFYHKLWEMKKEVDFPPAIIKSVVLSYPAVLETLVINHVTKCTEIDQSALQNHLAKAFEETSLKAWVRICIKYPQVFQISSSMIQTLLHFSRGDRKVLAFAQTFHQAISNHCNLIHQLYPVHLQTLVRKLKTRMPGDEEVLAALSDLIVVERAACHTLLTAFPQWLPTFLVFAVNHRAASIISEEFGDWNS